MEERMQLQLMELCIMVRRVLPEHLGLMATSNSDMVLGRRPATSFTVSIHDRRNSEKIVRSKRWSSITPEDRSLEKWLHGIILKNHTGDYENV